jgi:uncharacterized protein
MKSVKSSGHDALINRIKKLAESYFDAARGSHDWEHTLRVCKLCERIGPAEGADMVVLISAAYLHDIGRQYQDASNGAVCHAEKGARLAEGLLNGLPLSDIQKQNIVHCIQSHRYRGRNAPRTLEARALFDADKLDAIGAVGVARAYLFAGEVGARLHNPDADIKNTRPYSREDTGFREYEVKLSKIHKRILTREGRKLAVDRHRFMTDFFHRFLEEYEGKR